MEQALQRVFSAHRAPRFIKILDGVIMARWRART
jgi:hypothetical protein